MLDGLLSPEAAAVYRSLLLGAELATGPEPDSPPTGPESDSPPTGSELDELHRLGLVSWTPEPRRRAVATDPREVFVRLLGEAQRQIGRRHEELAHLIGALDGLRLEYDHGAPPATPGGVIEVLRDHAEIVQVARRLRAAARERYSALVAPGPAGVPPLGWPEPTGTQVRVRLLYAGEPPHGGEPPRGAGRPRGTTAAVRIRVIAEAPLDIRITDDHTAVLALTSAPADPEADIASGDAALLVRSQPVVRLLARCLSLLWERAAPAPHPAGAPVTPLTPFDQRVLALLAEGYRDEQIARLTGTSTRTVRRRVTAILAGLGAESRFSAGVEAYHRGWLPH
jgi:DNA-binding CsgD family transcriptional regulator